MQFLQQQQQQQYSLKDRRNYPSGIFDQMETVLRIPIKLNWIINWLASSNEGLKNENRKYPELRHESPKNVNFKQSLPRFPLMGLTKKMPVIPFLMANISNNYSDLKFQKFDVDEMWDELSILGVQ